MNIIFNEIYIINKIKQTAKYQNFTKGINIVYSKNGESGNYVGKSTLLKSLYHTLGADALFDDSKGWEKDCKYYYILNFNINEHNYNILRHDNYFAIYDYKNNIIFSTSNREHLSNFYSRFFNMNVYLKSNIHEDEHKYILALPAAMFCLSFLDQKKISGCKFDSFDHLNQYFDFSLDIIFSHLGINDNEFNRLQDKQNYLSSEIKKVKAKLQISEEMINKININEDLNCFSEEVETLKKEIDIHKEKYNNLIEKLNKEKKELSKLYNEQVRIINFIKHLEREKGDSLNKQKILNKHECPLCKNIINNYTEVFFKKIKSQDQIVYQLNDANELLKKTERKIEIHIEHYKKTYADMERIETLIYRTKDNCKNILNSLGMKEYKKTLVNEYYNSKEKLLDNEKEAGKNKKLIEQIQEKKKDIEKTYVEILNEMLIKYSIDVIELPSKMNLKTKIKANDNHVLTTLWLCTLNRLKFISNKNSTFFPLVLDNPTDRDLDDRNSNSILRMIFDMKDCCEQIIVSKVSFNESLLDEYTIDNRVHILNDKYQLLNVSDYQKAKLKLEELLFAKKDD